MDKKKTGILSTLMALRGNAAACIWTEWMWAAPNALYAAYATLYMQELGLSLLQIGMISSICLAVQVVASLLSGVIADKAGRRWTTFVVDTISWGIPVILWSLADSYEWFVAAALFNGLWRITGVTFGLLLAEDTPDDQLVGLFSINQLMSLLSALFAPISKICIDQWGLVPTMRVIYAIAAVLFISKFIILFFLTKETSVGKIRIEESRNTSVFKMLWDCRKVFWNLMKSKEMLLTIGIMVAYNVVQSLNSSFWSLIVTERMGIAKSDVSLYAMLKSLVQIAVIFLLVPHISAAKFRSPLLMGLAAFAISQLLVIVIPVGASYAVAGLIASVTLEAVALSCLYPVMSSLMFINSDPKERSRLLGMVYAVMVLIMAIFPTIAGALSEWDNRAPLYINIGLLAIGAVLTCILWNVRKDRVEGKK